MIFVTVGTQDKQFKRLITAIEDNVKNGNIKDEVIVQSGFTEYKSDVIKVLNYIPYDEFNNYINNADIVITHGGVGSIISALKLGKKVIAVARLAKHGEHVNDHQLQIIEKMSRDGYIIDGNKLDDLAKNIEKAENFTPKKYESNTNTFLDSLQKEINEIIAHKE